LGAAVKSERSERLAPQVRDADKVVKSVTGKRTRRTLRFASLGGATLDNEENYLIKSFQALSPRPASTERRAGLHGRRRLA
jgi:hypothetical protein